MIGLIFFGKVEGSFGQGIQAKSLQNWNTQQVKAQIVKMKFHEFQKTFEVHQLLIISDELGRF